MKTKKLWLPMFGAIVLAGGVIAADAAAAAESPREMSGPEKISVISLVAVATPGNVFMDWMTPGVLQKWNESYGFLIAEDGSSAVMSDFFSNAVMLTGTQNDLNGVFAFFNPFQDTVLLIQTDNADRLPRIEDFVFMTGSDFRGETLGENECPQALMPTTEKLDEVLLKNVAAVTELFNKEFPASAKEFSLAKYRKLDQQQLADHVVFNTGLRLALLEKFTKAEARQDAETAGEIAMALWEGDAEAMAGFFATPANDTVFLKFYADLPVEVKDSMFPVLYLKSKTETLFGFASNLFPGLVVLVRTGADGGGKPFLMLLPLTEKFAADLRNTTH